jgi:hypothetical protein
MMKSRSARLERLAERLVHADGLGLPAGPVWTWSVGELDRLAHLIEAGSAVRRAVWARLSDADLEWIVATWGGDGEVWGAADDVRPP